MLRTFLADAFRRVANAVAPPVHWCADRLRPRVHKIGGRPTVVPLVLGLILTLISWALYQLVIQPPVPPSVQGSGTIFVDDASVLTTMKVSVDPAAAHEPGRWPLTISLAFAAPAPPPPAVRTVRWALVLDGDARFVPATLDGPPGMERHETAAADPPFALGNKHPVEVLTGAVPLTDTNATTGAVRIRGDLPAEPFDRTASKLSLTLPRYGRLQLSPLFTFPNRPGALDIGVPGAWKRPDNFEVDVDAGPNGADQRIDVQSPNVQDPTELAWQSGDQIRAVLTRTNISAEATGLTLTFLLGAIVGAGSASILTSVERGILAVTRRDETAPAEAGDPEDPPPPAG